MPVASKRWSVFSLPARSEKFALSPTSYRAAEQIPHIILTTFRSGTGPLQIKVMDQNRQRESFFIARAT